MLIPGGQFVIIPRTLQTQGQLNVPVYQGGLVKFGVKAADARVLAGEETLRGTEASVFSQVVAAYNDVLRDTQIVEFNRANVRNLEVNLRATQDRFEVGDLTRTDVAQSEARLSQARADLRNAEANLIGSKERYIQQVGEVPADLSQPPPLPGLPRHRRRHQEQRGRRVRREGRARWSPAHAVRLWHVQSQRQLRRRPRPDPDQHPGHAGIRRDRRAAAIAAVPRQAQARKTAAMENQIATERAVIQQVRAAFASWKASLDVIKSAETAIAANSLSLEGVRAVLNAEQELINARVALATARRNAYVAGFTLLAAMGNAEARDLDLQGVTLYDSKANYARAKGQFLDWTGRDAPMIRSTRTVSTPAQDAATAVADDASAAAPR